MLTRLKIELDDYWRFRNWCGAHHNEWGSQVSNREALTFIRIVEELAQLFECPNCGQLVVYDHDTKVVHCPLCVSKPQPKVIWQFKPDWRAGPDHLLSGQLSTHKKSRLNAVRATRSALEKFLQDARRRLALPIQATPDDTYRLEQLYDAFFDWALAHPRPGTPHWAGLAECRSILDRGIVEGRWLEADSPAVDPKQLVETVDQVIRMFQCEADHLLSYDHKTGDYLCCTCNAVEPETGPWAHWRIVKGTQS